MDLEGVEVFVKVVEAGSFTEAARQLNLPKSTVSRRISRLEDNLRVRLLQRTTRKLALTDAGSAYFAQVAPALTAVRAADAQVGELQSATQGVVRITAPFDFGTNFLTEIIAQFTERYPDICMDVSLSDQMVDLIAEGYDVAFRGGVLEDSSLVARPLGRGQSWLVASPSYLSQRNSINQPEDLEGHRLAMFRAPDFVARWAFDGPDRKVRLELGGHINADEYGFLKALAVAGQGIAAIPWFLCSRDVEENRLVRVLPGWGLPGGQMHLVYPSARYLPQRVALFRDFVLEWVKDSPW